jgi:hypothetical protein
MKVTDLRRKLMVALAAGGLLVPSAAWAANLNANLIVNGGFENVDLGTTSAASGPLIKDWAGMGFTYSHDGTGGVPNYANGSPLVGGGSYYFAPGVSGGGGPMHHSLATAITQTIDVSGGPSGTLIAGGTAKYNLSGFFNSYMDQTDYGVVQVDFLNGSNSVLASGSITPGPQALTDWTQFSAAGTIPTGTAMVKVSAWGVLVTGLASDGYMDNLDFQVSSVLPKLSITVNRSTGSITLNNQTGSAENLSGYSITSAFEGLAPANWLSIADNYDNGNPGPNQVDPAHAWAKQTIPGTHGDLTESDPGAVGASLADGRNVNLGVGAWIQNPNEDLVFQYVSNGVTVPGIVNYAGGPGGHSFVVGDLNLDGAINAADWAIVRTNQHTDLSGKSLAEAYRLGDLTADRKNDYDDFVAFKSLYEAAHGSGSFSRMLASVPEPSSVVLIGVGLASMAVGSRRLRHP